MKKPSRNSSLSYKNMNTTPTYTGFTLASQQYKALLKKNVILSWRNKRATLLQIISPIMFVFLMFLIDKAKQAQDARSSIYQTVTNPPLQPSPSIPPCEVKYYVKLPCYDFIWSGDQNPVFRKIVRRIMKNNPGRVIPNSKVKSFKTKGEIDDWLFANPMYCPGALHFVQKNDSVISYGIQTNSTGVEKRGTSQDPTFAFQLPLQLAAEREIARYLLRGIIKILLQF